MIVDSDLALSKSTKAITSQQPLSTSSSSSVPKAKTDAPPLSPSTASHLSTKPERAVDVIELKDRFENLARALLFLYVLLGLTLAVESVGTSFYSNSTFQWKAMARILSSVGYKFDNWPNSVPFPGSMQDKTARGIQGVLQSDRAKLMDALDDPKQPLRAIRISKNCVLLCDIDG